jgi:multiple sugar transport system ATP-binding protein/alpha-glucoside transport system ATP-binding protein
MQVGFRPENLSMTESDDAVIEGTLELVENLGEYALVHLVTASKVEFIAKTEKPPAGPKGSKIGFSIKPELVHFFDKNSGARLD